MGNCKLLILIQLPNEIDGKMKFYQINHDCKIPSGQFQCNQVTDKSIKENKKISCIQIHLISNFL